jgi:AbrB family looped-hinge helix DNA binding protein
MTVLTISQKGWVVIPAELRRKYDLRPGTMVQVVDYGGVLAIVPVLEEPIAEAAGMLRGPSSLTQRLIADHREEAARER